MSIWHTKIMKLYGLSRTFEKKYFDIVDKKVIFAAKLETTFYLKIWKSNEYLICYPII